jgi:DNA modification methylase
LNLGKKLGQKGSGRSLGLVENDSRSDWREAWALFPGDVAYVWHASLQAHVVAGSLIGSAFVLRAQIIWAKQLQVFSQGHYHWKHEPCWYAVRSGATARWAADRKQNTVWEIQNNNPLGGGGELKTGHSTQKPIECMKRPIENNSKPGDAVYDPFVGSGTTIIAAEMTGRKCYAIEIDPTYVDVALKRWQNFTGDRATLDGKSFEQVGAERSANDCEDRTVLITR